MDFFKLAERKEESSEPDQDQDGGDESQRLSFLVKRGGFHDVEEKEEERETQGQVEKEEGVFFE